MKFTITQLLALVPLFLATSVSADPPASFKVSEFTFQRPANWQWIEVTSQMRKAQLKITDPKLSGAAEVVFFHFGPGDGGGTKANVERWYGQFEEGRDKINARSEETTIGKHKVTYVHAEGTYRSGMPGTQQTPMANYALDGAIIEAEQGSVFVRMTGPKDLVKGALADFKKMIESGVK